MYAKSTRPSAKRDVQKFRSAKRAMRMCPRSGQIFSVSFVFFIHQQNKDNHFPTCLKQDIDYPSVELKKMSITHGNLSIAVLLVQLN